MNSIFAGHLGWEHRLVVPYKGIQDSPGFWIPRRGFRIPKPRIPNSPIKMSKNSRFNKQTNFRDSGFRFSCMARALGFRQIRLLSFSSQRTISTREYSQIISTSRWVKKVELYLSGWQQPINTRDRGFNHSICLICLTSTPELTANASESVLWRKISDYS